MDEVAYQYRLEQLDKAFTSVQAENKEIQKLCNEHRVLLTELKTRLSNLEASHTRVTNEDLRDLRTMVEPMSSKLLNLITNIDIFNNELDHHKEDVRRIFTQQQALQEKTAHLNEIDLKLKSTETAIQNLQEDHDKDVETVQSQIRDLSVKVEDNSKKLLISKTVRTVIVSVVSSLVTFLTLMIAIREHLGIGGPNGPNGITP